MYTTNTQAYPSDNSSLFEERKFSCTIVTETTVWMSLTGSCLLLSRPWQKWPLYSSAGTGVLGRPETENDTFKTLHNIKLKETGVQYCTLNWQGETCEFLSIRTHPLLNINPNHQTEETVVQIIPTDTADSLWCTYSLISCHYVCVCWPCFSLTWQKISMRQILEPFL